MEFTTLLWAAFSNNPTLGKHSPRGAAAQNGSYTHYGKGPGQGDFDGHDTRIPFSLRYISLALSRGAGIQRWALPSSLAATKGILVSFFSSAY